jgi:hypothetical protein
MTKKALLFIGFMISSFGSISLVQPAMASDQEESYEILTPRGKALLESNMNCAKQLLGALAVHFAVNQAVRHTWPQVDKNLLQWIAKLWIKGYLAENVIRGIAESDNVQAAPELRFYAQLLNLALGY